MNFSYAGSLAELLRFPSAFSADFFVDKHAPVGTASPYAARGALLLEAILKGETTAEIDEALETAALELDAFQPMTPSAATAEEIARHILDVLKTPPSQLEKHVFGESQVTTIRKGVEAFARLTLILSSWHEKAVLEGRVSPTTTTPSTTSAKGLSIVYNPTLPIEWRRVLLELAEGAAALCAIAHALAKAEHLEPWRAHHIGARFSEPFVRIASSLSSRDAAVDSIEAVLRATQTHSSKEAMFADWRTRAAGNNFFFPHGSPRDDK